MITTTIVLPVSREQYLHKVFTHLELLKCKRDKTNLLVYVDGDVELYQKARNFTQNSKFNDRLCIYRRKGRVDTANVLKRRRRIADIHNELKEYIKDSEFVFLVEDDTLLPTTALKYLINAFRLNPNAGLISGLQLGRWGFLHVGAWEVDDLYEPQRITSIKPPKEYREVDATGLYCCLVRTESYIKYEFEPYEKILGPDFSFGLYLRKQGHKNYVLPAIRCGHLTPKEVIEFHNSDIIQVEFNRSEVSKSGWELTKK